MPIRRERRGVTTIAVAIGLALPALAGPVAPARAQLDDDYWSANLRYAGEFAGVRIAAATGYDDRVTVAFARTPSPELLFISPGGIATPPPPCTPASAQVVRCPVAKLVVMGLLMGRGDDFIETSGVSGPAVSGMRIRIRGERGNDRWSGGRLREAFLGGPGNDLGRAREGRDRLIGGRGDDRLFGGPGIDFFLGGPGNDFARGGGANDRGFGGPGRDDFED